MRRNEVNLFYVILLLVIGTIVFSSIALLPEVFFEKVVVMLSP